MTIFDSRDIGPYERWSGRLAAVALLSLFLVGTVALFGAVDEEGFESQAAAVVDGYVEATGGEAAYAKLHNRVTKATIELVGQGIELPITIYLARPNLSYTLVDSEVVGKVEKGSDGETVWEISVINGPQIKEGEERALTLRSSWFDGAVRWRPAFDRAEYAGLAEVEDAKSHKIVMTPKVGQPEIRYYDTETNLLVKMETTVEVPAGSVRMATFPSDYRWVDGVLMPFAARVDVLGQERRMKIESIEHNVELPDDMFDLPPEIQDLLAKKDPAAG